MIYNGFRVRASRRRYLPFLIVVTGCATALSTVPEAWRTVPEAATISPAQLRRAVAGTLPVAGAAAPPAPQPPADIRVVRDAEGARLFRGDVALTPVYEEIESFDVSLDRGEVIFSARRDANFDVGLVAIEGSAVNWIPEDPADELAPRWAPRGNKASFILRNPSGDFIRTVHIPTAVQLLVSFPNGRIRGLEWDRPAERFAVSWESPEASQRIEMMRYGGEERRIVVPPAVALPVAVAPFGSGLMLTPSSMRYEERLPLVIWISPGERNAWDDARGVLLQNNRVAALVVERAPDAALLETIRATPWVDASRMFLVDPAGGAPPPVEGITAIVADPALPGGTFRRRGSVIGVHPAVVKSFAARFISEKLKGTSPSAHR